MTLEAMIKVNTHGVPIRHYVLTGHEVSLCNQLTTRRPVISDRMAHMCRRCDGIAESLRRKG